MRISLALIVASLTVGCQNFHPAGNNCPAPCGPNAQACAAPQQATCVEVKPPKDICVKLPPQKVVINTPAPQQAAAPMQMQQPVYAAPPVQQPAAISALVQSSPLIPRLALGIDWIPIPFPVPRLFSVPAEQRVTAVPVTQASFAAAPAPMQFAAPAVQPPVIQAPQQMMVPVVPVAAPPPQQPPCGARPSGSCAPSAKEAKAMQDALDSMEKKVKQMESFVNERMGLPPEARPQ